MTLLPEIDVLFYAKSKRSLYSTVGGGDQAIAIKVADKSHSDTIFKAVACDAHVVIADAVYQQYGNQGRVMLLQSEFEFIPVGPFVAEALGILQLHAGDG